MLALSPRSTRTDSLSLPRRSFVRHAVLFGIGAEAMGVLALGMRPGLERLRSTWLGIAFAVALSWATAWIIGWFAFTGRGLHGAFFGIVTLALAVVFERLATH